MLKVEQNCFHIGAGDTKPLKHCQTSHPYSTTNLQTLLHLLRLEEICIKEYVPMREKPENQPYCIDTVVSL